MSFSSRRARSKRCRTSRPFASLYALVAVVNVAPRSLSTTPLGIGVLRSRYSIAYSAAALVALWMLRERLGTIGGRALFLKAAHRIVVLGHGLRRWSAVSAIIGGGGGLGGAVRLVVCGGSWSIVRFRVRRLSGVASLAGRLHAVKVARRTKGASCGRHQGGD